MRYRDHKGSLRESMKTERKVKSKSDIINHLNKMYKPFGAEIEEIKFKHVGMDERIGWETYYVLQRFKGNKDFTVAGMSDGCFDE